MSAVAVVVVAAGGVAAGVVVVAVFVGVAVFAVFDIGTKVTAQQDRNTIFLNPRGHDKLKMQFLKILGAMTG